MSRSRNQLGLPGLPELTRSPTLKKVTNGPRLFKLASEPQLDEAMHSEQPATKDEFLRRYENWNRGTIAEFAIYDYLTTRLKLQESNDFFFIPTTVAGGLSTFYVGPLAWRITNDQIIESKATSFFNKSKLQNQGLTVVDINAQNLQFGLIETTLNQALRGHEA